MNGTRRWIVLSAMVATLAWAAACGDGGTGPTPGPNQAPLVTGTIPAQTVPVGQMATVDVSGYFSDPDGDALSYAAESSDAAVASVSISGATLSVSAVARGTATITVTASDPGGLSARQGFAATVPNRAPEAADPIPDFELAAGDTVTVDLSGYFSDPDGDPLTFAAGSSDATVASVSVSGVILSVAAAARGTATITVTASDPGGLVAEQGFAATVPNRAPEAADPIPDFELAAGDTVTVDLSGYFSDPDGDNLAYSATSLDPAQAVVSVSEGMLTVTAMAAGNTTVTVVAWDPDGLSAEQRFAVTVSNRAPRTVGRIEDRAVFVGHSATVDAAAYFTDPDGQPLAYEAATSDPAKASVSVTETVVTVRGEAVGSATITVSATDPGGLSAAQSFRVDVETQSAADLVIEAPWAIPDTVAPGGTFRLEMVVSNRGKGTTASGTTLRYRRLDFQQGTATEIGTDPVPQLRADWSSSQSLEVTSPSSVGAYYYDACVDAVANESNVDNNCSHGLEVHVLTNRSPQAVGSIPDQRLKEGDVKSIDVAPYFDDPDGDDLTYTLWTWSETDSVFTATLSGSHVEITAEDDGYGVMRVIASDSESPLSAEHQFQVVVDGVFNIDVHYIDVADNYRPPIKKAIDRWSAILVDTETEDMYWNPVIRDEDLDCNGIDAVFLKGTWTDDHAALVTVKAIDGPGGIRAQAGYCLLHYGKPVLSAMIFDEADIGDLQSYGNLTDVAFHEMAHSLGFVGTHWQRYGLADYPHSDDPHFKGRRAIQAFDAAGGADYGGNKVPIGSAYYSHWRKSVFGNEGMTLTFNLGDDLPFSAITLQAMADLGYYSVDVSFADDYRLPSAARRTAAGMDAGKDARRVVDLSNDVLMGPVGVIGADGLIERVIPAPVGVGLPAGGAPRRR